ncbi:MAG: FtsH protease activity modulator HflK, partial [Gammaproteobacteria bacterium]|nr:FtsH protease activity modulator HflK [Gammaproteobacteria bacterium]
NQSPDLEEVINNVRKRFGGGGRGGKSGGGGSVGGFSPLLILVVVGGIFWLTQSFYQVDEGYQSIELQFGKFKETVGAGLQFIAWPIEEKIIVDTQEVRTVEVGYRGNTSELKEALMLTRDENIVDVTLAVQYTIKSIEDLVFNVGDLSYQQGLDRVVRTATESALREVVGGTKMDDLLTTDRPLVDSATKTLLQAILDRYRSGIKIESIEIQDAKPPLQVRDAFDDVVKADQDQVTLVNQAEAYAKGVIPNARGQAARIMQESEAYKAKIVADATGEAKRFNQILIEYQKAPAITKKRLYIETMESVLATSSKVMIDQKQSNGNSLMYLPIDKIIEGGRNRNLSDQNDDNVLSETATRTGSSDDNRRGGR